MAIGSIVYRTNHNKYVWFNAIVLLVFLFTDLVDPFTIVMAYFLETIIIGLVHCFKMYFVAKHSDTQRKLKSKPPGPIFKVFFFLKSVTTFKNFKNTKIKVKFKLFQFSE